MATVFIYQPTTGDRVFHCRPSDCIRVVVWQNGCRHVTGGVHFSWQTANPRQHWRGAAVTMARAIVDAVGGVAWGENGVIHLVVPHTRAYLAWDWMCDTATAEIGDDAQLDANDKTNIVRMIVEGVAGFTSGRLDDTPEQCTAVEDISVDCELPSYCPSEYSDEANDEGYYSKKGAPWTPVSIYGGAAR